jgi:hypothetical protein
MTTAPPRLCVNFLFVEKFNAEAQRRGGAEKMCEVGGVS